MDHWLVSLAGGVSHDRWRRGNQRTGVIVSGSSGEIKPRYFEDFPVGAVFEFGAVTVTEPDIIAFARQFDPQTMHTDPEEAAKGPTQGLIASGWHTVGLMMRMYAEHVLPENGLPAPGVDELRWLMPVRPGDTLRMRVTIHEARVSQSKPDRGIIRPFSEVLNQRGEVVLTVKPINLVRRRP
jgi:acyl dehydratase